MERENLQRHTQGVPNPIERSGGFGERERIYKVKLENAQIWVLELGSEVVVIQNKQNNWKAYLLNEDKLDEINPRLVPFLIRLVELRDEIWEIEKMLADE